MAFAPASASADIKKERLSFAKIAAAGIKPPSTQLTSNNNNTNSNAQQKQDITSQPRDGAPIVTPSNGHTQPPNLPKPKKIVQLVSRGPQDIQKSDMATKSSPEVHVQMVESVPQQQRHHAPEGSLVPAPDDSGTQISSSSGSNKPQSLDGKSVASGTNFTLDEKDSLRPDDSASVKAVDEDDMFSPPGSGLLNSRIGSDDGVRAAFRDQLREISSAEARGRPQMLSTSSRGVLYVPPQGPGIGAVPNVVRSIPEDGAVGVECPPDQKLLEALDNPRDRVWVLKLEQDVIDFVKDPKESSMTLPQCHSFYRLLAHKMADYYMLGHHIEDQSAAVRLYKTPDCRIPPPLTATAPSTAVSTPPPTAPAMKILRRDNGPAIANGSNMPSKSGSENGDSGDEKKTKGPVSREEREARYEAARLRIMGSAKPGDVTEVPKEKQDSRASSTTGKKKKNKARLDDDDGFEARSAYANFYTPPYGSDGQQAQSSYNYPDFTDGAHGQYADPYGTPVPAGVNVRAPMQQGEHTTWTQQSFDPAQAWAQGQPGGYDLLADFQRSMTFQNQIPAPTSSSMGHNTAYGSQYYGGASAWPQQQYEIPTQSPQSGYGYNITSPSQYSQQQQEHSYAFGQLPSQAFPGKAPSMTEHPLPGSYKGKHFNPQSQSFIPGQANTGRPYTPQQGLNGSNNAFTPSFSSPAQLQRQTSAQSQSSTFGSPHHGSPHHHSPHAIQNRPQNQAPLMHPLPQPVFPRQPSPSLPLPPKPGATPQQHPFANGMSPPNNQQNQSLLAKWGTPASLPAKPSISAEQYEAMKAQQMPRQTFCNPAAAFSARLPNVPSPAYPSFGSMPQPGPGQIVNGSYTGGNRRM
ncbi:R3H domain-containing protein 2 [Fulvia fulva]|uniref:R3H domain-containing protein 2 n=1 Tax=Passalora fulva TaxID=5499 RepID=A0A9Q8PLK1_PASFU|nr:R3H domain-containing protein 2 [Fulvia fulva]UJO24708.1 R3H domain-containing protein 2 [Fulvia fulva]